MKIEKRLMPRKLTPIKIEPIDPPEKAIVLQRYAQEKMSEKQAMEISQKLRKVYAKYLSLRKFGEMENAVLAYDSARSLAIIDKRIIGAISYHYDELSKVIFISHLGTLMSPKGAGAELVRTAVDSASRAGVGMAFESTPDAVGFWIRLGFERDKKFYYIFEADFKKVRQIKKALGSMGRVKGKT